MDTIIDTRQFPKEMEEKPQPPKKREEKSTSPLLWFIFFLIILFGGYYLYVNYFAKRGEAPIVRNAEKRNEIIKSVVEKKKPVSPSTYRRAVSNLFGNE